MSTRVIFLAGLALFGFDVARLNMTGVAVAGVVLMVIAFYIWGAFTRSFWIDDDPRLAEIDAELEAAGL